VIPDGALQQGDRLECWAGDEGRAIIIFEADGRRGWGTFQRPCAQLPVPPWWRHMLDCLGL
jgi:hypothetical protein